MHPPFSKNCSCCSRDNCSCFWTCPNDVIKNRYTRDPVDLFTRRLCSFCWFFTIEQTQRPQTSVFAIICKCLLTSRQISQVYSTSHLRWRQFLSPVVVIQRLKRYLWCLSNKLSMQSVASGKTNSIGIKS